MSSGAAERIDFHRLLEITKRRLGEFGLVTVSDIVTGQGGRIVARPRALCAPRSDDGDLARAGSTGCPWGVAAGVGLDDR